MVKIWGSLEGVCLLLDSQLLAQPQDRFRKLITASNSLPSPPGSYGLSLPARSPFCCGFFILYLLILPRHHYHQLGLGELCVYCPERQTVERNPWPTCYALIYPHPWVLNPISVLTKVVPTPPPAFGQRWGFN